MGMQADRHTDTERQAGNGEKGSQTGRQGDKRGSEVGGSGDASVTAVCLPEALTLITFLGTETAGEV